MWWGLLKVSTGAVGAVAVLLCAGENRRRRRPKVRPGGAPPEGEDAQRQNGGNGAGAQAVPAGHECARAGCSRPTWNGSPGEFCSKTCRASGSGSEVQQVASGCANFLEIETQFREQWQPMKTWRVSVSAPNIARIYKIDVYRRRADYVQCQKAFEDRPRRRGRSERGNEVRRFHGTRLNCNFTGTPCCDQECSVCCIIRRGRFTLSTAGTASSVGVYGPGLYFTALSHTAKGYGVPPAMRPPGNLGFARHDAGNALFLANVLAGVAEKVAERRLGVDPPMPAPPADWGCDSRLVNKRSGVDELVVFREEQAIPRYLIIFGP